MGTVIYMRETDPRYEAYQAALQQAGAAVVSGGDWRRCDGLLLPGGGDITPALYGRESRGSEPPDRARDREELTLLHSFLREGKPVLGICRGLQVINVYFGGTLVQDISGHSAVKGQDSRHAVRGIPARLLPTDQSEVNSAHHQSVERLGRGLRAVQWAEDGTVEALEHEVLPVMGVQWHPERWGDGGRPVFEAFIRVVKKKKEKNKKSFEKVVDKSDPTCYSN